MMANLNVGIGSNLQLKQRLRQGKPSKKESEWCTLNCWGYIEVTTKILQVSCLHRAKSSPLNAIEYDRKKIRSRNSGDIILK